MNLYQQQFEKGLTPLFFKKHLHNRQSLQLLKPQKQDKILEIGCNRGHLVKLLRNYSHSVVGIDINKEIITHSPTPGLKVMSAEKLEFADHSFDKIISVHTLEHVPNLRKTFFEIERVLKKNGLCVLIYPLEIFRGSACLFNALFMYGNPLMARKLHLHKLTPQKIARLTNLRVLKDGIIWAPFPTYFSVLKKQSSLPKSKPAHGD